MAAWTNNINDDGLFVRFGSNEGDSAKGGTVLGVDGVHWVDFLIDYTDALSATYTVLGSAVASTDGSFGVVVPEGARIEALETIAETAFTSSGTIGSAVMSIGLKKDSDRSTELDHDGFTTTGFVGSVFDAAGERVYVVPGVTGAGALIGTTTTESGVICVANTAHATHPFTAGKLRCRLGYRYL